MFTLVRIACSSRTYSTATHCVCNAQVLANVSVAHTLLNSSLQLRSSTDRSPHNTLEPTLTISFMYHANTYTASTNSLPAESKSSHTADGAGLERLFHDAISMFMQIRFSRPQIFFRGPDKGAPFIQVFVTVSTSSPTWYPTSLNGIQLLVSFDSSSTNHLFLIDTHGIMPIITSMVFSINIVTLCTVKLQ